MKRLTCISSALVAFAVSSSSIAAPPNDPGPATQSAPSEGQTSSGTSTAGGAATGDDPSKHRAAKNTIFIELGGNALLYSLNYERFISDDFSVRAGFGYIAMSSSSTTSEGTVNAKVSLLMVPILANYFVGGENHKLGLGLGVSVWAFSGAISVAGAKSDGSVFWPVPTAFVGYRYAPKNGGFNANVGFTPFFAFANESSVFVPWFGGGLGYGF